MNRDFSSAFFTGNSLASDVGGADSEVAHSHSFRAKTSEKHLHSCKPDRSDHSHHASPSKDALHLKRSLLFSERLSDDSDNSVNITDTCSAGAVESDPDGYHTNIRKPLISPDFSHAMESRNRPALSADFRIDGNDVLLALHAEDFVSFACTNRIAGIARNQRGFTTSRVGTVSQVQITLTATATPMSARRAILHEREHLMQLAEAAARTGDIRCRNMEVHLAGLTHAVPLLVVYLLFEGNTLEVSNTVHANTPALLCALERISGGSVHTPPVMHGNPQPLVQASVCLDVDSLGCGDWSGLSICERIATLHQLDNSDPNHTASANTDILRGVAPVLAAASVDPCVLEANVQVWAGRADGCLALSHWALHGHDTLRGTLTLPVPMHLADRVPPDALATGVTPCALTNTAHGDRPALAAIVAAVALAHSLATLRNRAIAHMQQHCPPSTTAAIGSARLATTACGSAGPGTTEQHGP